MKIDEMQMVILIISTLDIKVFRSKDYRWKIVSRILYINEINLYMKNEEIL